MSTPSPSTSGAAAVTLPTVQSSPQLSGIWANRSHVIRPYPSATPTKDMRWPLPSTTPTEDLNRPLHSPSPPASGDEPAGAFKTLEQHPQRGGAITQKGAWSKPGSGAAVVKSSSQGPPSVKAQGPGVANRGVSPPVVEGPRHLKHSVSGPMARGNVTRSKRHASESGAEQISHDHQQRRSWQQGSRDQHSRSRDHQQRSRGQNQRQWRRVGSMNSGKVDTISEHEGEWSGFQRSYSTTQAHQIQSDRKSRGGGGGANSRKPYSEPAQ
jgi:hypothetical protein